MAHMKLLSTPFYQKQPEKSRLEPAQLDRLADAELQHGHHANAERLAHLAAEMREAGR